MKSDLIILESVDDDMAVFIQEHNVPVTKCCGYYAVEEQYYYLVRSLIEEYNQLTYNRILGA